MYPAGKSQDASKRNTQAAALTAPPQYYLSSLAVNGDLASSTQAYSVDDTLNYDFPGLPDASTSSSEGYSNNMLTTEDGSVGNALTYGDSYNPAGQLPTERALTPQGYAVANDFDDPNLALGIQDFPEEMLNEFLGGVSEYVGPQVAQQSGDVIKAEDVDGFFEALDNPSAATCSLDNTCDSTAFLVNNQPYRFKNNFSDYNNLQMVAGRSAGTYDSSQSLVPSGSSLYRRPGWGACVDSYSGYDHGAAVVNQYCHTAANLGVGANTCYQDNPGYDNACVQPTSVVHNSWSTGADLNHISPSDSQSLVPSGSSLYPGWSDCVGSYSGYDHGAAVVDQYCHTAANLGVGANTCYQDNPGYDNACVQPTSVVHNSWSTGADLNHISPSDSQSLVPSGSSLYRRPGWGACVDGYSGYDHGAAVVNQYCHTTANLGVGANTCYQDNPGYDNACVQPTSVVHNSWSTGADLNRMSPQSLMFSDLSSSPGYSTAAQYCNVLPSLLPGGEEVTQAESNLPVPKKRGGRSAAGEQISADEQISLVQSTKNKKPFAVMRCDPEEELYPTGLCDPVLKYSFGELRVALNATKTDVEKYDSQVKQLKQARAENKQGAMSSSQCTTMSFKRRQIRLLEDLIKLRKEVEEENKKSQLVIKCALDPGAYLRSFSRERYIIKCGSNEYNGNGRASWRYQKDRAKVTELYVGEKLKRIDEEKRRLGVFLSQLTPTGEVLKEKLYTVHPEAYRKVVCSLLYLSDLGNIDQLKAACDSLLKSFPTKQSGNQEEAADSDEDYEQSYRRFLSAYLPSSMDEERYAENGLAEHEQTQRSGSKPKAERPFWRPGDSDNNPSAAKCSYLGVAPNKCLQSDDLPYLADSPWVVEGFEEWLPKEPTDNIDWHLEELLSCKSQIEERKNEGKSAQWPKKRAELHANLAIFGRLCKLLHTEHELLIEFLAVNGISYQILRWPEKCSYSINGRRKPDKVPVSQERMLAVCELIEKRLREFPTYMERFLEIDQIIRFLCSTSLCKECRLEDLRKGISRLVSATEGNFEAVKEQVINEMISRPYTFDGQGVFCLNGREFLERNTEEGLKYYVASRSRRDEYLTAELADYAAKRSAAKQSHCCADDAPLLPASQDVHVARLADPQEACLQEEGVAQPAFPAPSVLGRHACYPSDFFSSPLPKVPRMEAIREDQAPSVAPQEVYYQSVCHQW